jgi:hypothetical protein
MGKNFSGIAWFLLFLFRFFRVFRGSNALTTKRTKGTKKDDVQKRGRGMESLIWNRRYTQ